MKKRILALAVTFLLFLQISIPAAAAFNPETRESVAVVYTCLDMDAGELGFGWGTGFFVGETGENPMYLITNYHVISDFVECGGGELISYNYEGVNLTGRSKIRVYYDSKDYEEAYLVDSSESMDLAVLKLGSPTSKRKAIAFQKPEDSMVGSKVYAVGYPGLAENVFSGATTTWGISDASVVDGIFSRIFVTEGTGRENIQITCDIKHGNSGGPLVNENGAVIGVNTWGITDSESGESIKYAVSINEVLPMLTRNNISYEFWAPDSDPAAEATPDIVVPASAEPSKNYGGIVAALAVVLVAGAAVYWFFIRKKMQQPKQNDSVIPATAPAPALTPYVRSHALQHRGARVAFQGGQILIGRSQADCAIAFSEQTPGVSGRHCSLSWDSVSGDFILTDLNSTYGTFLQDRQRLTPGVPYHLRAGDSFFLGEEGNLLTVELG